MRSIRTFFVILPSILLLGSLSGTLHPAHARSCNVVVGGLPVSAGAPACADTSCTGFLICQNLEGTGYDNSETWYEESLGGGTVDEDYATSPLRGSQSLQIVYGSSAAFTYEDFGSSQDEIYGHFLFRATDATPAARTNIMRVVGPSSETVFGIFLETDGKLSVMASVSPYDIPATTDSISDATDYRIWFHYTKSSAPSASDGTISVEFTASATRTPVGSGSKFASDTHDHQSQARVFGFRVDGAGTYYFDQALVKSTAIGTVCE